MLKEGKVLSCSAAYFRFLPDLEFGVGAIAEGRITGLFTLTQGNLLLFFNGKFHRREASVLVRAVAEGLIVRISAGAVPVITGF